MGKKRTIPIRRKLTVIILATCGAALLAGGAVHFLFQVINFRESFSQDVAALAQILAKNSTAAIAFQDSDTANEVLAALGATPHVVSARLETPDASLFASFGKPETFDEWRNRPLPIAARGIFDHDFLIHRQPVILDGEQVGTLFLKSDYGQVWRSILRVNAGILVIVIAISLLVAYLVSSRLQRIISEPVHELAETARNIAENHDYSLRAVKHAEDEIGAFTDAFNIMLDRIQTQDATLRHEIHERERAEKSLTDAQHRLVEASRAAGMAEVATGVLHNVGNVLNSVNVSTTLIGTRLRESRAQNIGRLSELLQANQGQLAQFLSEDERGRQLPKYLGDLSQHLADERDELLREVLSLEKNVGHIKDIVAVQQTYARRHGIIEAHSAQKLVEDAIQMSAGNMNRHEIKLIRGFSEARLVAAALRDPAHRPHPSARVALARRRATADRREHGPGAARRVRRALRPAAHGHRELRRREPQGARAP
jgi:methyl-accepting chemotaxis protein